MVINNLIDRIYIVVGFEKLYSKPYTIYKLDSASCPETVGSIHGEVSSEGTIEVELSDGKYQIVIQGETADTEECFSVFYNKAFDIMHTLNRVLCSCDSCDNKGDEIYFKAFYDILAFMTATGLLCRSRISIPELDRQGEILNNNRIFAEYYGTFKFDYINQITKFLAHFYVELYYLFTDNLNTSQEDLDTINNLLNIDLFEKCLFSLGYSFNDMLCNIQKCNCNE